MTRFDEEECIHGLMPATCSLCRGTEEKRPRPGRATGATKGRLDTPASIEKYRGRYSADRQDTFDAYKDVFFRVAEANRFPGGWTMFSRGAIAEPALARSEAALVKRAEGIMSAAGYVYDDSDRPSRGGRKRSRRMS